MRRTPIRSLPYAACGLALLLVTSCGLLDDGTPRGPALTAPAGVTAQAGSATSVHVMWSRPEGGAEVRSYTVYRGATRVKEVPGEQHMTDVVGLRPRSAYTFSVRAEGPDGASGPLSAKVAVTTPAAVAEDRSAPSRPGALRGHADGGRAASLSWGASHDDKGVVSYDIYQGTSKIHSVGGGETRALVTGLRPGTAYAFTVKARDAADNTSPAGPPLRLTTAKGSGEGPGTAPTDFRAASHRAGGAYYIDLSWTPPRTGGTVPAYRIYLDGRLATTLVWGDAPPKGTARNSFYVGKEAGVRHRVRIRAQLPDGTWGAPSAERGVSTGP
ncbi:fibronectin type III domain-containing protein [Streptomyces antnestii]|uniref:fibronectin type III domain-containing protein n=1 Tax=Streptomyces antnestii TaxID=2494256 RepID=UPI001CB986AB|nr:fibronectin type III domain-containing protein [Streptomyces sp. San01]